VIETKGKVSKKPKGDADMKLSVRQSRWEVGNPAF